MRLCETLFIIFLMVIYFWERERERAWAREEQRERERQNPKQAPGSELSAQSWTRGSNSLTMRSWPELNWLSHPGAPKRLFINCVMNVRMIRIKEGQRGVSLLGQAPVSESSNNTAQAPQRQVPVSCLSKFLIVFYLLLFIGWGVEQDNTWLLDILWNLWKIFKGAMLWHFSRSIWSKKKLRTPDVFLQSIHLAIK